jgi:hypothetical protein
MEHRWRLPVASNEAELVGLMRVHEAIRAHMKLLINSVSRSAKQSSEGGADSVRVRDLVWGYRWALYDFVDGIRHHLDLDEITFTPISQNTPVAEMLGEHSRIRRELDCIVRLADDVARSDLDESELVELASGIQRAVHGLCRLIDEHTMKEDRLLTLLKTEAIKSAATV